MVCNLQSGIIIFFFEREKEKKLPRVYYREGGYDSRLHGVLISKLRGLGLSPGRGHCVVFLGKTLTSHSAFPYPGV